MLSENNNILPTYNVHQVYVRLGLDENYRTKRTAFARMYKGSSCCTGKTVDMLVQALSLMSKGERVIYYAHTIRECMRLYELCVTYAKKLFKTPNTLTLLNNNTINRGSGSVCFIPYAFRHTLTGTKQQHHLKDDYSLLKHVCRVGKDSRMCLGCRQMLRGRTLTEARYKRALFRENPDMSEYVLAHDRAIPQTTQTTQPKQTHLTQPKIFDIGWE